MLKRLLQEFTKEIWVSKQGANFLLNCLLFSFFFMAIPSVWKPERPEMIAYVAVATLVVLFRIVDGFREWLEAFVFTKKKLGKWKPEHPLSIQVSLSAFVLKLSFVATFGAFFCLEIMEPYTALNARGALSSDGSMPAMFDVWTFYAILISAIAADLSWRLIDIWMGLFEEKEKDEEKTGVDHAPNTA